MPLLQRLTATVPRYWNALPEDGLAGARHAGMLEPFHQLELLSRHPAYAQYLPRRRLPDGTLGPVPYRLGARQLEFFGFFWEYLLWRETARLQHLQDPAAALLDFRRLQVPGGSGGSNHIDAVWNQSASTSPLPAADPGACALEIKLHASGDGDVVLNDPITLNRLQEAAYPFLAFIAYGSSETEDETQRPVRELMQQLRHGPSSYTMQRAAQGRPSRLRKQRVTLDHYRLVYLSPDEQARLGTFAQGQNSNGKSRHHKLLLREADFIGPSAVPFIRWDATGPQAPAQGWSLRELVAGTPLGEAMARDGLL